MSSLRDLFLPEQLERLVRHPFVKYPELYDVAGRRFCPADVVCFCRNLFGVVRERVAGKFVYDVGTRGQQVEQPLGRGRDARVVCQSFEVVFVFFDGTGRQKHTSVPHNGIVCLSEGHRLEDCLDVSEHEQNVDVVRRVIPSRKLNDGGLIKKPRFKSVAAPEVGSGPSRKLSTSPLAHP